MANLWSWLFGARANALPPSVYNPPGDLVTIAAEDIFGQQLPDLVTAETAQRVPGAKRALAAHLALAGRVTFRQYDYDRPVDPQPAWLTTSQSGCSPWLSRVGVFKDLFHYGWAAYGFELGPDQHPVDGLHIPFGQWSIDDAGAVHVNEKTVPARYRELVVVIPLGLSGFLVDAADTIREARKIEEAYMRRLDNPTPQTTLEITADEYKGLTLRERRKIVREYDASRVSSQTRLVPWGMKATDDGKVETTLYETGRNAARLDIANHGLVPASVIEGAKNGGSGEMNYSNSLTARNETYDYGTALFVGAFEARMSLDDVCPPGQSIRGDLTALATVPTPTLVPVED